MPPILKFKPHEISAISEQYQYRDSDARLIDMKEEISQREHLTKDELIEIARWKSPRTAAHAQKNHEDYVSEITRFSLQTRNERARIESLLILDGVSWPTASVILHFFHNDPYPILDFRALWSVSLEVPSAYNFDFWFEYVKFCRLLAQNTGVEMRTLDRALWQYSKENQSR